MKVGKQVPSHFLRSNKHDQFQIILCSTITFISLVFTLVRSSSTLLPSLSLHLPGVYTGKILLKIIVSSHSPVFTLVSFCLFAHDLVTRLPTLLIFCLHSLLPACASNFLLAFSVTCPCFQFFACNPCYLPMHASECLH